jgi:hypothetical protein
VAGACTTAACPTPYTSCPTIGIGAGGAITDCTDTQTDPANCGGCVGGVGPGGGAGHACRNNQICVAGVCQDYEPVENASAACTTCPCTACPTGDDCCANATYGAICLGGTACP